MNYKRCAILGATSDMAKAFAHEIAKQKIDIILIARDKEKLEPISKDIRIRYEVQVDEIIYDVEKNKVEDLIKKLNSYDYEMFISFVGYLGDQRLAESQITEAKKIYQINYIQPSLIIQEVANHFLKISQLEKRSLVIIGVSSVAGDRGRQSNYFYGSAKAGFTQFLSGLRNRLSKEEIHIITVKPGFVRTTMTANMKLPGLLTANPEDAAKDILKAIQKKKNIIYTKWFWRYIMLVIQHIPEPIFKKLSL